MPMMKMLSTAYPTAFEVLEIQLCDAKDEVAVTHSSNCHRLLSKKSRLCYFGFEREEKVCFFGY